MRINLCPWAIPQSRPGLDHQEHSITESYPELLEKRVSHAAIARILGVNRGTVTSFVKRHGLAPARAG